MRLTEDDLDEYIEKNNKIYPGLLDSVINYDTPQAFADTVAGYVNMKAEDAQSILDAMDVKERLMRLHTILMRENELLRISNAIDDKVKHSINENQKEYFLKEQMRVIQKELTGEEEEEVAEYRRRLEEKALPEEVREKAEKELKKLERMNAASPEYAGQTNYLDWILDLPWCDEAEEEHSLKEARKILDEAHYGLKDIKERILEFIALRKKSPDAKSPILCLVGPPGVGKTSIAASVAEALNKPYVRMSLGGMTDENEIRGHRRTYVGAMPGRIISAINQAGSCNPLLLLDEIDKLGHDHRGDPASALLEVLDAEQNSTFRDNFLELPFDLSDVMFITTANTTDTIPRPLLDRMEVIELPSYTDEEKLQIAKRYLLPKEMKRHGLEKAQLKVSDGAIREMVASYTRESGVRVLERKLAGICRKAAMHLVSEDVKQIRITEKELKDYLGAPRYYPERQALEERVGVVNGLAWTSVGGELLEVEVNVVPGTGKVELTGNLGDVMKESAHAALSFIRSQADRLGIQGDFYQSKDIHVHFPEGAVPKDGPSAGIAITTAMVSALTGAPVKRGIAMTGEVTLRGRVLPIGGLREKTMAALRNGIKTVIIPAENGRDLDEIDQTVRKALRFVLVDQAEQVLAEALCCLSGGAEAERAMDRKLPGEKSRGTARLRQ